MPDIVVSFPPREGERKRVADLLPEAAWMADGADARDARVLLSFWPRRELRELGLDWADLPRLEHIQLVTAGANHVGWSTLPPNVRVSVAPGGTAAPISEYVLGAVLSWARGFARFTSEIRAGRFRNGAPVRGLRGLRVGIVGYGAIGQATARLLAGLGCDVAAVNRSPRDAGGLRWLGTMDDVPRLAAESRVLVVCVPLVQGTEGLIDAAVLEAMPADGALLVHVSRGPVVAEADLHAWLAADADHRAAHVDVWWHYPHDGRRHPFHAPFDALPNITMTPHNSPNVEGFRLAMLDVACRNVRALLDKGRADFVQDPADYRTATEGDGRDD